MPLKLEEIVGKRIGYLGQNDSIDLSIPASYPIFTTGIQPPSLTTAIYCVLISPKTPRKLWDSGTCTFSIDGGNWALSQELNTFSVPASVFSGVAGSARGSSYPPGHIFTFDLSAGNANNGLVTATAYGWTA